MKKISLIGGGNIGSSLAYILSLKNIAEELAIYDINEKITIGKALDISQATAIFGSSIKVNASNDISIIKNSSVIIVTAGIPRKPGMSREDLLSTNLNIIKNISENIKKYSPESLVIVVTNPIDIMVYALHKFTGLPKEKVIGMAGVLDVARYKFFLSQEFKVSVSDINAFILGGHGDFMVPLRSHTTVSSIPILEMIEMGFSNIQRLNKIIERTKYGGGEIVSFLGSGSAYYAPAAAIMEMIESYLGNKQKILPCSVLLNGEYGFKNVFAGVPVILGNKGVEKIISLKLAKRETEEFNLSVTKIQNSLKSII